MPLIVILLFTSFELAIPPVSIALFMILVSVDVNSVPVVFGMVIVWSALVEVVRRETVPEPPVVLK